MTIRGYFNRKFSRNASRDEGKEILDSMKRVYSSPIAQRVMPENRRREVLETIEKVDRVVVYPWMLSPPSSVPGVFNCFGPTYDFRYDAKTRTFEIGGAVRDLLV